ncbi:homeobox protein 2 [Contarinia nasturtii]|uniref:homeobox protein 2 n=1 Tax=Contarinia nasturtii TaxID=265458 RepID=UPI0012D3E941|nr:homeobox protein 2 [Contarinia nasturtii]
MMIRESVQVLICLSVLVSMSASLHMIRDAYHRPINELSNNNINRDSLVYDSTNTKIIPENGLSMRATRNPLSNNQKYHELFPSSVSSSSSVSSASGSSSSSSPSSTLPLSMSFRSGSLARSSVTDTNGRYRWQKQTRSWKTVPAPAPAPASQPATTIQNNTDQSKQPQQKKQRRSQAIRSHMSKRTSNAAHMDDDDEGNMDMHGYNDRNFNDYNDNSADHMGITDDDLSQPPIAKGLPTKFMFRGMRGQRQYDVPQIECPPAMDGMERFACPTPDRQGRYRCIDDHVLCDGFIDCPDGEDEERQACMFYKTTKAHLDVLADALLRWARGR